MALLQAQQSCAEKADGFIGTGTSHALVDGIRLLYPALVAGACSQCPTALASLLMVLFAWNISVDQQL